MDLLHDVDAFLRPLLGRPGIKRAELEQLLERLDQALGRGPAPVAEPPPAPPEPPPGHKAGTRWNGSSWVAAWVPEE